MMMMMMMGLLCLARVLLDDFRIEGDDEHLFFGEKENVLTISIDLLELELNVYNWSSFLTSLKSVHRSFIGGGTLKTRRRRCE